MIIAIILLIIGGFIYVFAGDKKIKLPDIFYFHFKEENWANDDIFDLDSDFDNGSEDE